MGEDEVLLNSYEISFFRLPLKLGKEQVIL